MLMDTAPRSLTREDLLAAIDSFGARASVRALQLHLGHRRSVIRTKLDAAEAEGLLRREETWALHRGQDEAVAEPAPEPPAAAAARRCASPAPCRRPVIRERMSRVHQRLRAAGDDAWMRVDDLVAELRLPRAVVRHTLLYLQQEGLAEPGGRRVTGRVGASSRLWRARP